MWDFDKTLLRDKRRGDGGRLISIEARPVDRENVALKILR